LTTEAQRERMTYKEDCSGDWGNVVVHTRQFFYAFLASYQFICFGSPPRLGVSVVNTDG
jgi:hypothetical protein